MASPNPSSTPAPTKPPITLTDHTDPSSIPPAAATLASAFGTDPVLRWVLSQSTTTNASLIDSTPFLSRFFLAVVSAGLHAGGTITAISQPAASSSTPYDSVGILIPPGHDPDSPRNFLKLWHQALWIGWTAGPRISWRILATYPNLLKRIKASTFNAAQRRRFDYFYVFFLGTLESARGQGLASAWLRRCQDMAAREGKAVWLESSTVHSRDLYARLGWEVVCEEVVGKGWVGRDGRVVQGRDGEGEGGAEGARLWGMVWWPEGLRGKGGREGGVD